MKVAIITTRHDAQDDRIYFKEALSLAKKMEVVLVAPDDGGNYKWGAGVRYRGIPRRRGVLGRLMSLWDAFRVIREVNPDFCHLHDLDLVVLIPFLKRMTHTKIIYDSHEVFTKQDIILNGRLPWKTGHLVGGIVEWVERQCAQRSDLIVTAVEPEGQVFQRIRVPLRAVYNYPPMSVFDVQEEAVEKERNRFPGRQVVIYQGTMSEERGLFLMLEAVALVRDEESEVLLRLIGLNHEKLRQEVEKRIVDLGLEEHVEIDGWLAHERIADAMRSSQIGLVPLKPNPKYQYALPIKLLEYMACGLPVIVGRLGLVDRYVNEAQCGVLYDSTSSEELAQCILRLLRDEEKRRTLGANGLRFVKEKWNWGEMEKVLWEAYREIGSEFQKQGTDAEPKAT